MDERQRNRAKVALVWLARVGVAATFVVAAVPKLLDLPGFATDIQNYRVFPTWSANILAAWVPALELVGAASILTGWKRRAGAWLLGGLTLAFIALIGSVIARGIDISCGCFGSNPTAPSVGWPTLWRDVALLAAIVVAAWPLPRRAAS